MLEIKRDFPGPQTTDILGDQSLKFSEWEKQAGLHGIPEGTFKKKPGELVKHGLVVKSPVGMYRSKKSLELEMALFG